MASEIAKQRTRQAHRRLKEIIASLQAGKPLAREHSEILVTALMPFLSIGSGGLQSKLKSFANTMALIGKQGLRDHHLLKFSEYVHKNRQQIGVVEKILRRERELETDGMASKLARTLATKEAANEVGRSTRALQLWIKQHQAIAESFELAAAFATKFTTQVAKRKKEK
ncbi:MAG TPA: hypothetical protein VGH81_10700 [Rudaea sp.]|jgi:hypothetical protein